jgi:hypothetical protein
MSPIELYVECRTFCPTIALSAKHASNHSMMKNPYFNAQSVAKTAIEAASLDC